MIALYIISGSAGAAVGALAAVVLMRLWQRAKPQARAYALNPTDIIFLVENGEVIDESQAAKGLLTEDEPHVPWVVLVDLLAPRFPNFPATYEDALALAPATISPAAAEDIGALVLDQIGRRLRITVRQAASADLGARHHLAQIDQISLKMLTRAVGQAPFPVWIVDDAGDTVWHNPAYDKMLSLTGKSAERLDLDQITCDADHSQRINVTGPQDEDDRWFEVSCRRVDSLCAYYATDISKLVHAELAQRGFVQTLTKTFANLGTGLAIFDRQHRLVLFNPALIELTQMSAEFLTSRPSLTAFFDWLRDNRVMPEPRDYAEWRVKLRDLTKEATEGTFSELWSLPNGLSFRVLGRPQTDGAVAFLFEDVTAELSLTRNFIKELEINNALLDRLPQALAIFSPTGDILAVNAEYKSLWDSDPNETITLVDVPSAVARWSALCKPTDAWDGIARALNATSGSRAVRGQITLLDGRTMDYSVEKLGKGASAILFDFTKVPASEKQQIPA